MKRVLVTGISGFVGHHVIEPLRSRGFEIHSASRSAVSQSVVVGHAADLLVPGTPSRLIEAIKPTHLLHLAWVSNPGRAMMSPENDVWAKASLELFRAFAKAGGKRAVFAGSSAEYDWDYELLREGETPLRPRTAYGTAKSAVCETIEAESERAGVSAAWARIFFLYGPHEPPGRLVSDVAAGLIAGTAIKTTEGRQERDFLHVADAAEALVMLVDNKVTGAINIASGECVPVRRVVETLGRLSGRAELLQIGARPGSTDEPARLAADVSRLKNEVGFNPRYDLQDGLAATLQWWRDKAQD
jgi:nucleoside-diphosphate-sugar epimerase